MKKLFMVYLCLWMVGCQKKEVLPEWVDDFGCVLFEGHESAPLLVYYIEPNSGSSMILHEKVASTLKEMVEEAVVTLRICPLVYLNGKYDSMNQVQYHLQLEKEAIWDVIAGSVMAYERNSLLESAIIMGTESYLEKENHPFFELDGEVLEIRDIMEVDKILRSRVEA